MLLSIDMEIFTDLSFLDDGVTNQEYFPRIIKCLSFYRASAERQNLSQKLFWAEKSSRASLSVRFLRHDIEKD